jgi:hypothetical protein
LNDSIIPNLTERNFENVFAPKVNGALNLDQFCRKISLKFMILYSSVASGFGSPGQANYGAANAVLDEIAERSTLFKYSLGCLERRWYGK